MTSLSEEADKPPIPSERFPGFDDHQCNSKCNLEMDLHHYERQYDLNPDTPKQTGEMERILDKLGKTVAANPRGYGPASAYHEALTALQALQDKKVAEALIRENENWNHIAISSHGSIHYQTFLDRNSQLTNNRKGE